MIRGPVFITGCSRGLGLEMVKQLSERTPKSPKIIVATCRNPEKATDLLRLQESRPNIKVQKLDVTAYDELPVFVENLKVKEHDIT